jgi:ubiquitin-conjugating enzyme E2 variant
MKHDPLKINIDLKIPTLRRASRRQPKPKSEFPLQFMDVVWVLVTAGLLITQAVRLGSLPNAWDWRSLLLALVAMPAADFVSGMIHWFFDTWGNERTFFIGPRLIRPFRVHHAKPDNLLGSHFFTTNSDSSLANLPFLLIALCIPLGSEPGRLAAVFLTALAGWGVPTSQIHKWSHAAVRPFWVSWLQRIGLILSPVHHHGHHTEPHTTNYCITTGWCNRPLQWIGFFPKMEWLISRLTGLKPRQDEPAHESAAAHAKSPGR